MCKATVFGYSTKLVRKIIEKYDGGGVDDCLDLALFWYEHGHNKKYIPLVKMYLELGAVAKNYHNEHYLDYMEFFQIPIKEELPKKVKRKLSKLKVGRISELNEISNSEIIYTISYSFDSNSNIYYSILCAKFFIIDYRTYKIDIQSKYDFYEFETIYRSVNYVYSRLIYNCVNKDEIYIYKLSN